MLEVRVLGPIEIHHDSRPVHFGRRQQRLIVGILALEANQEVSCERLIDLLWGEDPPRQARSVVQTRLSEARATLSQHDLGEHTRLVSSGDSYVLQIPDGQVDAQRFRRAAADHRNLRSDELARVALRDALALWRGPVLGTRAIDDSLGELCQSLEAARLTAWEDLFEVELRLGRHFEIVDELVELAARNRSRERLVEHMMLALHRTGRSTEALQAYDRWRRWLSEELGADPGSDVQSLHVAILDNDPDLFVSSGGLRGEDNSAIGFVAAVPRTLPPITADFTGRETEIASVSSVLTSEDGSDSGVVAVSGPAGAGKTALAIQAAHMLRDRFADGQLYANLHGADFDEPESPLDVLGRFLRALGVDGQALPASLDERAELYRDLVAGRRMLVVLDNAASDDQILPLLPSGPHCAAIVTGRSRLGVTFGARLLDLPLLEPEQAQDLLGCIAGASRIAAEPEGAAKLVELCGYLPLAIRVMGAKLVAKPHWSLGKLAALCANENSRLDQLAFQRLDVRSSIGLSYVGLPDDARRLLRLVCDIDLPDVTLWASAALLEADARTAESALENLFDAHLIDVTGRDAAGYPRYRLHDLVRLFARERAVAEDSPDQLRRSRERIYRYCLTLAERQQVALNGDGGRYIKGVNQRWSPDESLDAELLAQPMQWFDQERQTLVEIVQRAANDGCGSLCWELASASGPLLQMRYDFDGLQIILPTALRAADGAGDERGRAAMLCGIGLQHVDRRENEQATKLLTQASSIFDHHGDHRSYGNLVLLLATISRFAGDRVEAVTQFEQALELLQAANDEVGVAWVLRSIGQCYLDSQEYERARGYLERSLQKYRSGGASRGEAMALFWIGMLQLNEGQAAIALATFQKATAITRHVTDRPGEAQCLRGIGLAYQAMGERDRAEETLITALDMVRQPRPTILEGFIQKSLEDLTMARPAR